MTNRFFYLVAFVYFFFNTEFVKAGSKAMDSLVIALKNASHDTTRCKILYLIIEKVDDDLIWPVYNEQLLKISSSHAKLKVGSGNHRSVLDIFYLMYMADALNNKGYLLQQQGNIPGALDFFHSALNIQEEIKFKKGEANSLNNIGLIYHNLNEYEKALEYYQKALKIQKVIKDTSGIANSYNNIGGIYDKKNNLGPAFDYYFRALETYKSIGDRAGEASALINIGNLNDAQGDAMAALEYYYRALEIQEKINDLQGIAYSTGSIANVLTKKNKLTDAEKFAMRSLNVSRKLGFPENINRAAESLKKIYKKKNKYKEAMEMYELEIRMLNSINNTETKRAAVKKQFQYIYEKKAVADSIKNSEEQKVKNAQLTAQKAELLHERTQRLALYGGMILLTSFGGIVYNRFRVTKKQKTIIEKQKEEVDLAYQQLHLKNKEITDSILYARRIQNALLTQEKYFDKELERLNKKS